MSDDSKSSGGGIGVLGLLGVVFVTLKLLGIIDWSWWWVTAPFWGGLAFFLSLLALLAVGSGLVVGLDAWLASRRRKRRTFDSRRVR